MDINALLEYSNINFQVIKETFNSLDSNEETLERCNLWMLEVLKAYDQNKRIEILDLAKYINERISEHRENNVDIINKMQILKRYRKLTFDEKEIIYTLRDQNKDRMIQCAIAILLGNKSDFERYFSKLSTEEKDSFINFPIFNLMK